MTNTKPSDVEVLALITETSRQCGLPAPGFIFPPAGSDPVTLYFDCDDVAAVDAWGLAIGGEGDAIELPPGFALYTTTGQIGDHTVRVFCPVSRHHQEAAS